MALLHSLDENHFKKFDELADLVMRRMVTALEGNMQVKTCTIVFDRYFEDSIKDSERTRRAGGLQLATHVVSGQRDVPNYKRFLLNRNNKMTLVNHISVYTERNIQDHIPQGKRIVLAGGYEDGQLVRCITPDSIEDGDHLFSTQEEADRRILLHAIGANGSHSRIIVKWDDTDVLVLLLYYTALNMITISTYMQAGHIGMVTNRLRFIPIHDIVLKLGNSVVRWLPAVLSLTGCDSTNAMFRIGKRTAYNVLLKQIQSVEQLSSLGATPLCTEEHVAVATKYAIALYGNKKTDGGGICTSLDELRYVVASSSDKSASELPPTDDAYRQHIQRCVYQLFIWTHIHIAKPVLPSPIGHGWVKDEDVLKPVPFTKDPSPVEVRSLTHLFGSDKKCEHTRSCQCIRARLQCTEHCKCLGVCKRNRNN